MSTTRSTANPARPNRHDASSLRSTTVRGSPLAAPEHSEDQGVTGRPRSGAPHGPNLRLPAQATRRLIHEYIQAAWPVFLAPHGTASLSGARVTRTLGLRPEALLTSSSSAKAAASMSTSASHSVTGPGPADYEMDLRVQQCCLAIGLALPAVVLTDRRSGSTG